MMCMSVTQSCLTLGDPVDCSLPVSSVHRVLQARILEWVVIPFSRGSSWPTNQTLVVHSLLSELPGKPICLPSESEVAQSCPTLCDPMDCSLPGSSLHGILQARVQEWVAISFSRGSSWPRDRTWVSCIPGRRFNLWATRYVFSRYIINFHILCYWWI